MSSPACTDNEARIHEAEGMQVLTDNHVLQKAVAYLSSRITRRPEIALVLGSGLGDFANQLADPIEVPASAIPFYPTSSVEGHEGSLIFGTLKSEGRESLPLLAFKGRVHFYETGDLDTTLHPIRIAHALGSKVILATNAAGGINSSFCEGDLMLIDDFIDFSFLNPQWHIQSGPASSFRLAPHGYLDKHLSTHIFDSASKLGIKLRRGNYCYLRGPSYETKAEIEMLRRVGADAVGMSTVPEIIAAAGLGMRVAAISLISNLAAGLTQERLSHKEVALTASRVKQVFSALLTETILRIQN
jgi:purine-nucleoside phosphorylase